MGLHDDYTRGNQPNPGHAGHMMGQAGAPVNQHEIDDILKKLACQCK